MDASGGSGVGVCGELLKGCRLVQRIRREPGGWRAEAAPRMGEEGLRKQRNGHGEVDPVARWRQG